MRSVAILFAILLIAACPPRRGRVVYVQRCPQPAPVVVDGAISPPLVKMEGPAKPEEPTTSEKPNDSLAGHLKAWEEKTAALTNVRAEVGLTRTDSVTQKSTAYSGQLLYMKPNYAVLRLNNDADKTNTDYEAYICNGKSLYAYNGLAKAVTEFKSDAESVNEDDPLVRWLVRRLRPQVFDVAPIKFLTDVSAKTLSERFDIDLFKTDENYLYLDIKPRLGKDLNEFQHLRLALYGPGAVTAKASYLPAQVYILKQNGDTEVWKFTNPMVDIPGVKLKHFQYVEIKEEGWKLFKSDERVSEPEIPQP